MPNHITNCWSVRHDDPKLIEWLHSCFTKHDISEEETLDFHKIIPQPDNVFKGDLGEKEKIFCKENKIPDWYTWNVNNWGTKWGAYEGKMHLVEKNELHFEFQTAWAPPEPIIEKLEQLGFEVNGFWKDEGDYEPHEIGHGGGFQVYTYIDFVG